jgi:uncharacterized membrane protein (UPF0127 family)
MKIASLFKGRKLIAKGFKALDESSERGWGLMFAKEGTALLVSDSEGIWSTAIHTFFCVPLVVAWINSKNKVVDVKITKPWRFYNPKKPAKYVFETTDLKTKIKVGDKVRIAYQKHS